jgi:serine/threonine protein kinase
MAVYRAFEDGTASPQHDRTLLAVKIIDGRYWDYYGPGVEISRLMHHSTLLKVLDAFQPVELPEYWAVVMEYWGSDSDSDTHDMQSWITFKGRRPYPSVMLDFVQLAEAVYWMHQMGYVHNRIRLDNILVRLSHGGLSICLTGFSRAYSDRLGPARPLAEMDRADERPYLAPELFETPIGTLATDVFALGVCFNQILEIGDGTTGVINVIRDMTNPDPAERIVIDDVLTRLRAGSPEPPTDEDDCTETFITRILMLEGFESSVCQ